MTKRIEGIQVRYIYSACIVTTTPDLSILHDPWFTEGIYDGSWFHFPKIHDPLKSIGNVDYIYISHVHPDHYDKNFLIQYFARYGKKKILIADHSPNHLKNKMMIDGFESEILLGKLVVNDTTVEIMPHKTGSISDIDSAIIVKYESSIDKRLHCIVNANDIIFDEQMISKLKSAAGEVDILLCGYTGAGPYPQTYFDLTDQNLQAECQRKKLSFFERYKNLTEKMNAKINIPFAGKYVLGGRLIPLNQFRGVADPVEILDIDKNAIVLSDDGGKICTDTLKTTDLRTVKYPPEDIQNRLEELKGFQMDYERLINDDEKWQLPIKRLLISAVKNANSRSECFEDYFFFILLENNEYAVINANKNSKNLIYFTKNTESIPLPNCCIVIDIRYLFGLLTHVYHWNNAEVGSQYEARRTPNLLVRKAQSFLNYLTV